MITLFIIEPQRANPSLSKNRLSYKKGVNGQKELSFQGPQKISEGRIRHHIWYRSQLEERHEYNQIGHIDPSLRIQR